MTNFMKKEVGNDQEIVMKFIIMPSITVELAELSYKLFKISIIIMSL